MKYDGKSFKEVFARTPEEREAERRYFEASERLGRTLLPVLGVILGPDEKKATEMTHAIAHMDDPKVSP